MQELITIKMNTDEINSAMHNDKLYCGTFSIDTLPCLKKIPVSMITSTHPSTKPGKHWVAIYIKNNQKGIYFDSYGLPPVNKEIEAYLNYNCGNSWKYSNVHIQPSDCVSTNCGKYCILFCKAMSSNISFKIFLKWFTKSQQLNDSLADVICSTANTC